MTQTQSLALVTAKARGHELIDEIVKFGIERNEVYRMLRRRLNRHPSNVHFSRMKTVKKVEEAIVHLESILAAHKEDHGETSTDTQ